jgi:threonylcarbamoyladenosine tRNA methylthiotransferase MtaB
MAVITAVLFASPPSHGESRRSIPAVLNDITAATAGGAREIVLTGVHLGSWGYDFEKPARLKLLVQAVLAESDVKRVRLSSLEPWDLQEDFFELWQDPRLCRHLHLPLQSGCDLTLKRMARKTTSKAFEQLVQAARRMIPDLAVTTDVIVGFPVKRRLNLTRAGHLLRKCNLPVGMYSPSLPGQAPRLLACLTRFPITYEKSAMLPCRRFLSNRVPGSTPISWVKKLRYYGKTPPHLVLKVGG